MASRSHYFGGGGWPGKSTFFQSTIWATEILPEHYLGCQIEILLENYLGHLTGLVGGISNEELARI